MSGSALAAIDYVDSHARLRGSDVEVVLCGLAADAESPTELLLSHDGVAVSVPIVVHDTGETREVRARAPRDRLGDGAWSMKLVGDAQSTLDARLLVQGARPVVLLLGATAPRSVVPGGPRGPRRPAAQRPGPSSSQRVARAGGRVLDVVLRVLPAERAARVRGRARRLARAVLH